MLTASDECRGPDGADWGDGPVLEFDPPRRLVHEWRSAYDPELAKEPPSRVTWEIEDTGDGSCRLTVVHDRLDDSPRTARSVSGPSLKCPQPRKCSGTTLAAPST